ncbi:MAG TPA: LamG-like jellyroll fold domain-containing protein [Opitutaceae bacterium]|nr:LamG-like jellyroll fold domain-containing protein [Opitutaceae bacterium]
MNFPRVISHGFCRVLFFAIVSVFAHKAAAATVGYWRFESAATLTADSGGHAAGPFTLGNQGGDNANDAILLPGTGPASAFSRAIPRTGVVNAGAARFVASEVPWDAFSVLHNTAFNTSSFTIEALVNMASSAEGNQSRTIAAKYGTSNSDRMFRLAVVGNAPSGGFAPGSLRLSVTGNRTGLGFSTTTYNSNLTLNVGEDYWVAFTFRLKPAGGAEVFAYVKNLTRNTLVTVRSAAPSDWTSVNVSPQPFWIGTATDQSNGELAWDGVIDEVRFSNTALPQSELLLAQPLPVITTQPVSQTIGTNDLVVFSVEATGAGLTYQWYDDEGLMPGETSRFLALRAPSSGGFVGDYFCSVENDGGFVDSNLARLSIVASADPGKLSALSIRGQVGTGDDVMVAGLIVEGSTVKTLIQAVGPTLGAQFPDLASSVLADPKIDLHQFTGGEFILDQVNDDWGGSSSILGAEQATGATRLSATADAAVLSTLLPGIYTAGVSGKKNSVGIALLQAYAVPSAQDTGELAALSIRGKVGTGGDVLIAGIIVGGTTSRTLLIQAVGPTLGVLYPGLASSILANPKLDLYQLVNGSFVKIRENDDWGGDTDIGWAEVSAGATTLSNPTSKDCALLITLPPGVYTANVSGVGNSSGVVLLQAYTVP